MKNALWLFGAALLILLVFLPSYTKMSDLRRKNLDYDQKMIDLKKKNVLLKREKLLLEKDPAYLEKIAREKMGLVKEGEVVYRLTPMNAMVDNKASVGAKPTASVKKSTATKTTTTSKTVKKTVAPVAED